MLQGGQGGLGGPSENDAHEGQVYGASHSSGSTVISSSPVAFRADRWARSACTVRPSCAACSQVVRTHACAACSNGSSQRLGSAVGPTGTTGPAPRLDPATVERVRADLEDAEAKLGRLRHSFKMGLATNLSNPKIVLFLAAMIAPLLPASPPVWLAIALTLSLSLSAFLFFLVVATVISTNAVRRKLIAAGPWIDIGSGLFFIIAGIVLIISGGQNLLA